MKKIIVLFMIVLLVLTAAGCRKIGNTESSGYSSLSVQDTTSFTDNDGETEKTNTDTETEENNSTENESTEQGTTVSNESQGSASSPTKSPNKTNGNKNNNNSTVNNSSVNSTTSNTSNTSSASGGGNGNSNNTNSNNSNSAVSSTPSAVEPPAQPESESDEKWIANRVLELLNEERQKIGVHTRQSLPGLTKVAEMRAEQLTVYFDHDWIDENGKTWGGSQYVATQLKYGKFVDATLFGAPAEYSYYDYGAGGENCACGSGYILYTREKIAQTIVENFKGSSGHWQSLMSTENYYDGIGIRLLDNEFYCSINSVSQNLYG